MRSKNLSALVFLLLFSCALVLLVTLTPSGAAHDDEHGHGGDGGNGQIGGQPMSAMSGLPCVNGMAGTFPCQNVDLASFLPLASIGGGTGNDVWGWTDPLTNKEYALMGLSNGTAFVDISDAEHPVYLGKLPTHSIDSLWRAIKVYGNHAFIVSEAANHGMQVFDLTQLRNVAAPPVTFSETAHYNAFSRAHTIAINEETGFAYANGVTAYTDAAANKCARGLHIIDVRNPAHPTFAGCFAADGYTHDTQCVIYRGPDVAYRNREICFNSNEDTLTIVDVTDKNAPRQLSRTTYTGSGYTHQGWLTDDQSMFLVDDELDEQKLQTKTRTHIFDVSDLDAPTRTGVHEGTTGAIDHNLYILGRYAYQSNYRSGLRVLDISHASTATLQEVGYFDIYPVDDLPAFNGTWSNYPFFKSGVVIVSGIEQGLFVLRPTTNFVSTPQLLTEWNSTRAIALDSVTRTREPFSVNSTLNFSTDGRTRLMLFAYNVNLAPDEPQTVVTAQAEDAQQRIYPLTVEYVGKVPDYERVTQVVVVLPAELAAAGDVSVSINLRGTPSNKALIKIQ
ncbi:MAG TPA: choice-of-anchor B family protein [Pyrinomonadaceae bacterium]|nr:choice-of-anchor B family protein [Pyrinomonadaceae bacterium]